MGLITVVNKREGVNDLVYNGDGMKNGSTRSLTARNSSRMHLNLDIEPDKPHVN
ncbi:MAG TPA: hypothetical protein VF008_18095 [Niastella sp.]